MFFGPILVAVLIAIVLLERFITNWILRSVGVILLLLLSVVLVGKISVQAGRSLEDTRYTRTLPYLFSALLEYDVPSRETLLIELKQKTFRSEDSEGIEDVLDLVERGLGKQDGASAGNKVTH